jgi:hypothetical protein
MHTIVMPQDSSGSALTPTQCRLFKRPLKIPAVQATEQLVQVIVSAFGT